MFITIISYTIYQVASLTWTLRLSCQNPTLAFCHPKYMNSGTDFLQFLMQELHKTLLVVIWASKTWACCLIKSCQCIPDSTPKTSMLGIRFFLRRSVYLSVERTEGEDQMDQKREKTTQEPTAPKEKKSIEAWRRIKAKRGEFISKKPCTNTTSIG